MAVTIPTGSRYTGGAGEGGMTTCLYCGVGGER